MGGSESKEPQGGVEDGYFGVRVTAEDSRSAVGVMDAQSLEAVYNKGRSDAASEFQDLIPAIGAQVYGEASRRIEENIRESAEKEKELAAAVMTKIGEISAAEKKVCTRESKELKSCLSVNKLDPLVCSKIVEEYVQCANRAVLDAKQDRGSGSNK